MCASYRHRCNPFASLLPQASQLVCKMFLMRHLLHLFLLVMGGYSFSHSSGMVRFALEPVLCAQSDSRALLILAFWFENTNRMSISVLLLNQQVF